MENECGTAFHDCLIRHALWLPSTFAHAAAGSRCTTWTSPDAETEKRIDYIAVPQFFRQHDVVAITLTEADTLHAPSDHLLVAVSIRCSCGTSDELPSQETRHL